ncbi:MAG: bifunctional adenosylcobinamide kinase/adenosylcobinamide-phosphate guanylyltransferase [Bacillota bacterium]
MHLIFGGAYQGKLDYAKQRYQLNEEDIYSCGSGKSMENGSIPEIDFTKKAVDQLEEFVLCCVYSGMEARDYLEAHRSQWKDSIIICTDISAGVVPCDKELRAWREMVGRTMMYLGKEAEEVTRMFCGIPQNIK